MRKCQARPCESLVVEEGQERDLSDGLLRWGEDA